MGVDEVFPTGAYIGVCDREGCSIHVGDTVVCQLLGVDGWMEGPVEYVIKLAAFRVRVTVPNVICGPSWVIPSERCRIVKSYKEA